MSLRTLRTVLMLTLLIAATAPVAAQTSSGAAVSDADRAFAPIENRFRNLYESLQTMGGISEADHPQLRYLCDRVAAFSTSHPDFDRAVAMEYQLIRWLNDEDRADALLARLMAMRPDDLSLRTFHAETLRSENRYGEALAMMSGLEEAIRDDPDGSLLLSNLYFAEGRYAEAVAVLETIDPEELSRSTFIKSRVDRDLKTRLQYVELWAAEQERLSAEAAANDLPRAEIVLDRGRIVIELFENEAPNTVANFIKLAESGFYDGTKFHRVINNFMAQGGDPTTKEAAADPGEFGQGNPGYYIADEHLGPEARKHFTGSLAMAKQPLPNTAGSQFYIAHEPLPHLNGVHTVFGRVVSGLDVARRIENDDVIVSIRILRKRDHEYEPQTLPLPGAAPLIAPSPPVTETGGTP